jgi:hypothetical protein
VINYLSRYVKGGPIHPSRISVLEDGMISIRLRRDKETGDVKYLKLTPEKFFKLYLIHVPIPYVRTTRYYGLYSARSLKKLNIARRHLGQTELEEGETLTNALADSKREERQKVEKNLLICPHCKQERIVYRNIRPDFIDKLLDKYNVCDKSPPNLIPIGVKLR